MHENIPGLGHCEKWVLTPWFQKITPSPTKDVTVPKSRVPENTLILTDSVTERLEAAKVSTSSSRGALHT